MSDRRLPCPDCGSPVRPDVDQLCPTCGYPLMFMRAPAEDDARAVPRTPGERPDATGLMPPSRRQDTRPFPAATYGAGLPAQAAGQVPCRACGYTNDPARIRCERCGHEMRQARPQGVVLGPAPAAAPAGRSSLWLIVLIVLGVLALLSVLAAVAAFLWF